MQKNSSKEQNRQQNKQQNNQQGKKDQGHYFFYTDQLTVGYDGKPLIKEINIQLKKGEILTLIGPEWCRKIYYFKKYHPSACHDQRNRLSGAAAYGKDVQ